MSGVVVPRFVLLATTAHYASVLFDALLRVDCAPVAVLMAGDAGVRAARDRDPSPGRPRIELPLTTRSPIEQRARRHGIELLHYPRTAAGRDPRPFHMLAQRGVRLGVVGCFPYRLDAASRAGLPLGLLNLHPSLLPAWPGPNPVRDQIEGGDGCFGVSLHWLDDGLDTGRVIAQVRRRVERSAALSRIEAALAADAAWLLRAVLEQPGEIPEGAAQTRF
ncbi:MAG: hypothetical protein KDK91_02340 [Gammaproteobacteria bacterium]|nr:hypothetical protein [Gammaproteobacteria bacterium]